MKQPKKDTVIVMRANKGILALIDQAARMLGKTRSEYIRSVAMAEASRVLKSDRAPR